MHSLEESPPEAVSLGDLTLLSLAKVSAALSRQGSRT